MAAPRVIPTSQLADLITYTILIDGEEIPNTTQVKSISIRKEINKISFSRIKIMDGDPAKEDFPVSNQKYFIPGREIEIKLGYHSDNATVFKGIIITHSNKITSRSSELWIECKDKAVKLTIGKKNKHFEKVSDSDIAEQIIDKYSLPKEVETTTVSHEKAVQFNTTDWDFIVSRMDSIGRICLVDDGKIIIKKPDLTAGASLEVLYGATIMDYEAEIDARDEYNDVTAKTWDYSNQEIAEESGDEPTMNNAGNLSASDLAEVIGLDSYLLGNAGKLDSPALKDWADAKMMRSRLAKIKGYVRFQGFPHIKPGDVISLDGIGDRFKGPIFVSAIKHDYSNGNWITETSLGMPTQWFSEKVNPYHLSAQMGQFPSVQGLQIGIVTDLEDPEGEFRVKVRLPIVNPNEEGVWMRVATLDAGDNRGTFFRPEINDEVIVGFIYNDPNQPVILGMLNSSAKSAPLTPSNSNNKKGYVSRSGTKMIFDDENNSYKLETPDGKKITLDDNSGKIQIEDEGGNLIKMESSGVTIKSASSLTLKAATDIKLEGVNISLNPSSQFSVSTGSSAIKAGPGNAGFKSALVKIDGSGVTEIKGGIVKIN